MLVEILQKWLFQENFQRSLAIATKNEVISKIDEYAHSIPWKN